MTTTSPIAKYRPSQADHDSRELEKEFRPSSSSASDGSISELGSPTAHDGPSKPRPTPDEKGSSTEIDSESPCRGDPEKPDAPSSSLDPSAQDNDTSDPSEPADAGVALEQTDSAPIEPRTKLQTTLIVLSLCCALFLAALDTTIITTAVPVIASEFNSTLGYTWIGSAYLLGNSASVPSWGKISDIWGRKPILLIAAAVFWVGSLLAATSVSMGMLIAARAIQGVGGGGVIVLVNICITDLFSMRDRGFYYGVMGMVWAVAGGIGPVLGGVFTSKVTWRWCFYVNLPVAGTSIAVLFLVLKLHNPRTPMREGLAAIDWLGSISIVGGTLMFLLGLEFGGVSYPWNSPTVICLLIFGVVTLALFTLNEWKLAKYPVVPLRLFQERSNIAVFCVCACHGYAFVSGTYWLPLYFQSVQSSSSLMSGVFILPYTLSLAIVSATAGMLVKKTGKYLPLIIGGMAIMTLGFGLMIDLPSDANWAKIILYQIVAGIGVGPNFQSPLIALQNRVEKRDMASATAMFQFLRQLFTSISVVIGGVVFQNEQQKQYPMLVEQLGHELADKMSGEAAAANVDFVGALEGENGQIARNAYAKSISTMFIMYTAFSGIGLLLSLGIEGSKLSRHHQEHKTGLKTLMKHARTEKAAGGDEESGEKREGR